MLCPRSFEWLLILKRSTYFEFYFFRIRIILLKLPVERELTVNNWMYVSITCVTIEYLLLCYQRLVQSVSELQQVILGILVVHCFSSQFLAVFYRFLERVTSHFYLINKRRIYLLRMLVLLSETIVCFPVR